MNKRLTRIANVLKAMAFLLTFLLINLSGYGQCSHSMSVSTSPNNGSTWVAVGPSGTTICDQPIQLTAKLSGSCSAYTHFFWKWTSSYFGGSSSDSVPCSSDSSVVITPDMTGSTSTHPTVTITYTAYFAGDCSGGWGDTSKFIIHVNPTDSLFMGVGFVNSHHCAGSTVVLYIDSIAGNSYSWTSQPPGLSSALTEFNVNPTIPTTYYCKTTTSHGCSYTDSSAVPVNALPTSNVNTHLTYICPRRCTSCTDTSAVIGTTNDTAGNKYLWASHPGGDTSFNSAHGVAPTVNTTYHLTITADSGGCTTKDSEVVDIGTYTDSIIGGAGYGWTGHRHNCHDPQFDIEIWGDSATYGTFTIKERNFQKGRLSIPQFTIQSARGDSSLYTSPDTAEYYTKEYYTIRSVNIDGGLSTIMSGNFKETLTIGASNTHNSDVWLDSFNGTGTILFGVTKYNYTENTADTLPLLPTPSNIYTSRIHSTASSNIWGIISFQQDDFKFVTGELYGVFNFYTNAYITIPWGNELYINSGATLQGISSATLMPANLTSKAPDGRWSGIVAYGTDRANPASENAITSKQFPYTAYFLHGYIHYVIDTTHHPHDTTARDTVKAGHYQNFYQQGALVVNSGVTIKDADTGFSGGGVPAVAGVSARCGGILIAQGASFENCNVTLGGDDPQFALSPKKDTTQYERFGSLSYLHGCTFTKSNIQKTNYSAVYLDEITFDTFQPTLQGCNFYGTPPIGCPGSLYSYSSTFSATGGNNFYDSTGIYISDVGPNTLLGKEDIEGNNFNCSSYGIYAKAAGSLTVKGTNIFALATPNSPSAYNIGLYLDKCNSFTVQGNYFNGDGNARNHNGSIVGVTAYNAGGYLINYNNFTYLTYGAQNFLPNPNLQYRCNTFDQNGADIVVLNHFGQASVCNSQGSNVFPAGKLPQLVFESKSIDENRELLNIKNDENEEKELIEIRKELSQPADINEDISELDIIVKINSAFKTIEVLGQILKNNYGKMTNPVILDLVEETYLIGLRTLSVFFTVIEENTDFLVNHIISLVDKNEIEDKERIKELSKRILFNICNQISYNFIKKVSDSLGTQNLENSYEQVLLKHEFNSVKLIDFSIKIDHFKRFPNTEMSKLKDEFDRFPLSMQVMKRMVINYLKLFPTTYEQKQKILSFLNIEMSEQRRIDATSTQKRNKKPTEN